MYFLVMYFFYFCEPLRAFMAHSDILWVRSMSQNWFFSHIGNVDNCVLIIQLPIIILYLILGVKNKKVLYSVLVFFTLASIYANLDAELNILPFINYGTPDPLDIPAGILGSYLGYCTTMQIMNKTFSVEAP